MITNSGMRNQDRVPRDRRDWSFRVGIRPSRDRVMGPDEPTSEVRADLKRSLPRAEGPALVLLHQPISRGC